MKADIPANVEAGAVAGNRPVQPAAPPNIGVCFAGFVLCLEEMKTRKEIVENWLPRYTGVPLDKFGGYILLTNFDHYVKLFAQWHRVPVLGRDKPMPSATAGQITIINFGMGSATAATVMDLLSAICPKAVLFLGNSTCCLERRPSTPLNFFRLQTLSK